MSSDYNVFQKGSMWGKWDLHVHSPASAGYKGTYESLLQSIIETDCSVVGINDYVSVDGYKTITKKIEEEGIDIGDTKLLPVVEFRMNNILLNKGGTASNGTRINFHIIFNSEIDSIEHIENFIKNLKVGNTPISTKYPSDLEYLRDVASFDFNDVLDELRGNDHLKDNYLVWMPYDEHGGIDDIDPINDQWFKQKLINDSNIIGSSNKKQIDFFLWKDNKFTEKQYREWFAKRKPCIKGSDCHESPYPIGCLKDKNSTPIEKYCWIKADPTFNGLKQIDYEPETRVAIQSHNPGQKNDYEVIDKVRFIDPSKKEFPDSYIEINPNLNSIIGGKSSGKSLLLYHVAKTIDPDKTQQTINQSESSIYNYTFEKKEGFDFEVVWKDGKIDKLSDRNKDKIRPITFIPQLYLNSLAENKSKNSDFRNVIEQILKENESYKKFIATKNDEIANIKLTIHSDISNYLTIRNAILEEGNNLKGMGDKEAIEKSIEEKQEKLANLLKEIKLSDEEEKTYKQLTEDKNTLKKELEELSQKKELVIKIKNVAQLLLKSGINETLNDAFRPVRTEYQFDNDHQRTIDGYVDKIEKEIEVPLKSILENDFKEIDTLEQNIKTIEKKLSAITEKLEPIDKKLSGKENYAKLKEIVKQETKKIDEINAKAKELALYNSRLNPDAINIGYKKLFEQYKSIIEETERYSVIDQENGIDLIVEMSFDSVRFRTNFTDKISKKSTLNSQFGGMFPADQSNEYAFNEGEHLNSIKAIFNNLTGPDSSIRFNQGFNIDDVLHALFDDYLRVDYDLSQKGDRLLQMSPGKRGIILFQLFLHLSNSTTPILIDQPEDNLDNRTVFQELNEFIKKKKLNRQIIAVSHNANLVVSTDSEEIIVANQAGQVKDGDNRKYRFEYVSGSLEHDIDEDANAKGLLYKKGIKSHVCEILEGGEEAFLKREDKYGFLRG